MVHPITGERTKGPLGYASAPNPEYLFLPDPPCFAFPCVEVWQVSKGSKFPRAGKALRMPVLTDVPTPPSWDLVGNMS